MLKDLIFDFLISVQKLHKHISLHFHGACLWTIADIILIQNQWNAFRRDLLWFFSSSMIPKQKPRCAINNGSTLRALRVDTIRSYIKNSLQWNSRPKCGCDELDLINYTSGLGKCVCSFLLMLIKYSITQWCFELLRQSSKKK